MKSVNTKDWIQFRYSDIFITKEKTKKNKEPQIPTGASVPMSDLMECGKTPRITVSGINNGVIGYYDYIGNTPGNYRVYDNFISISFLGTVFYQEGQASLDMKVHCLKPKIVTLNRYTGLFLVSIIKASLRDVKYDDQLSSSLIPNLSLKLPVTSDMSPDWGYMEQYMKNIENEVTSHFNILKRVL